VPAGSLSGRADDPDHFVDWLQAERKTFAPRALYGTYLGSVLDDALAERHDPDALIRHRACAVGLAPYATGLRVLLDDGSSFEAERVVLATGHQPPATPQPRLGSWPEDPGRFVADPWCSDAGLDALPDGTILLVGTGLTMVDVALQLSAGGDRPLVAVSRHGLLPLPHLAVRRPAVTTPAPVPGTGLRALLGELRAAARDAVRSGGTWRDALDALRPSTAALWAGLTLEEQQRFLQRLVRYWDVHRHRMAPEVDAQVGALRAAGRLQVLAGRIDRVQAQGRQLEVEVVAPDGRSTTLSAAAAVNCTGPTGRVPGSDSALLDDVVRRGLARPHPLGLGLDTAAGGAVLEASGRRSERLFAIGPLRRGELWETTAIPEIRAQAAGLATALAGPAAAGNPARRAAG
jgi:uncharacterized NAD(P)/FAD-binding protein YdhS